MYSEGRIKKLILQVFDTVVTEKDIVITTTMSTPEIHGHEYAPSSS
jgi:hypothetical protein